MSDLKYRKNREPHVAPGGVECHAADLTVTIAGDVPLEIAQQRLAEFDQWIPIDGDPRLPVATLIEQNSSGPLRLGFGAWRDLLLGCQFHIGHGDLITAGGRTMKNVAGYDLTKFMVGQGGVFGSIVTITARAYKRPAVALAMEFAPSDQFIGQIIATPLRPQWALLTPQSLWCGWLDDDPALILFTRLAEQHQPGQILRRSLQEDIAHRASLWSMEGDGFRASVPPSKILAFAREAGLARWSADAAFGMVVGSLDGTDKSNVVAAAQSFGGSAMATVGGKPQWQPTSSEAAILESLKIAFQQQ
jgi:hypothetical protein